MSKGLVRRATAASLLTRLVERPGLPEEVRALPAERFAALVRKVGVEDAGEIVALATTEQLVAAFDEDLFVSERPGERESFEPGRFVAWLEVLLEAGEAAAARRFAELSEDFVVHALSSLLLVLDNDALTLRMGEGDRAARAADKALESSLAEEIDGYLLVSKRHEGWDAALALVLALDRDHRALLERVLDRSAALCSEYVEDLDALTTALTEAESLAEDVEAEREDRRAAAGHVEPRAARAFLALARKPSAEEARDPLTRAYFRGLAPEPRGEAGRAGERRDGGRRGGELRDLDGLLGAASEGGPGLSALPPARAGASAGAPPLLAALGALASEDPALFDERMAELGYVVNVLVAAGSVEGRRMRPAEAAEAALATVAYGAELEARSRRRAPRKGEGRAAAAELEEVLRACPADRLFRRASGALSASGHPAAEAGFLRTKADLDELLGE